jgi:hypothetical protein
LLTGLDVGGRADQLEAARCSARAGTGVGAGQGGQLPGGDAIDLLFDGHHATQVTAARADRISSHCTDDTLAPAIITGLARRGVTGRAAPGELHGGDEGTVWDWFSPEELPADLLAYARAWLADAAAGRSR